MPFPPTIPSTTAPKDPRPRHEFYRGDTLQVPFQVVDRNTRVTVDVTGWTFRFNAKYALANPDAQAAFAADNIPGGLGGIALADATQGQGVVTILPIVTRCYPDGPVDVEYDIQATDTAVVITTIEVGGITILPHATKSIGS